MVPTALSIGAACQVEWLGVPRRGTCFMMMLSMFLLVPDASMSLLVHCVTMLLLDGLSALEDNELKVLVIFLDGCCAPAGPLFVLSSSFFP